MKKLTIFFEKLIPLKDSSILGFFNVLNNCLFILFSLIFAVGFVAIIVDCICSLLYQFVYLWNPTWYYGDGKFYYYFLSIIGLVVVYFLLTVNYRVTKMLLKILN